MSILTLANPQEEQLLKSGTQKPDTGRGGRPKKPRQEEQPQEAPGPALAPQEEQRRGAPTLWLPRPEELALLRAVVNDHDAALNVFGLCQLDAKALTNDTARGLFSAGKAVWERAEPLSPASLAAECQAQSKARQEPSERKFWQECREIALSDLATHPALSDPSKGALEIAKRLSKAPAFAFTPLSHLKARPRPKWLIQDVLIEATAVVLSGDSQSFKTFSALDMALCVATGTPWHGRPVQSGAVVYIAAEGGWTLRDRLEAWETGRGIEAPEERFHLLEVPVSIGDVATVASFSTFIQERAPRLVVIDTLSACAEGLKENASEDMATFVRHMKAIARATGAAVVVIHHNNKGGDLRGAVSLKNDADTHITFERQGEEEELTTLVSCSKHRGRHFPKFALKGEEVWLSEPDEHGRPVSSLIFDRCDVPESSARAHPNAQRGNKTRERLLELFDGLALEYNGAGVRAGTWKARAEAQEVCLGGAFWRHLKELAPENGSGLIQKDGDVYRRFESTPTTPTTPIGSYGSEETSPAKTTPTTPITPLGVGVVGVGSVSVRSGSSAKSKKARAAEESEPYRATSNGS
jgi:hypothetical protein